jgi:hypothetical protein
MRIVGSQRVCSQERATDRGSLRAPAPVRCFARSSLRTHFRGDPREDALRAVAACATQACRGGAQTRGAVGVVAYATQAGGGGAQTRDRCSRRCIRETVGAPVATVRNRLGAAARTLNRAIAGSHRCGNAPARDYLGNWGQHSLADQPEIHRHLRGTCPLSRVCSDANSGPAFERRHHPPESRMQRRQQLPAFGRRRDTPESRTQPPPEGRPRGGSPRK